MENSWGIIIKFTERLRGLFLTSQSLFYDGHLVKNEIKKYHEPRVFRFSKRIQKIL